MALKRKTTVARSVSNAVNSKDQRAFGAKSNSTQCARAYVNVASERENHADHREGQRIRHSGRSSGVA
jgi:hypothetical protein